MKMPEECEFRQSCDKAFKETGIPCLLPEMGNPDKCELRTMAQGYLNSPQFNEQFVNRDSLEKEIREWMVPADPFFDKFKKQGGKVLYSSDNQVNQELKDIINLIRNHGLKEE